MARTKAVTRSKTKTERKPARSLAVVEAKKKLPTSVAPTREPGQRGATVSPFFYRFIPSWNTPTWYDAKRWRLVVRNQPIAMICRESLQTMVASADWNITTKDPSRAKELKSEIDYYTELFTDDGSFDFSERTEWLAQDLLDIPFGTGMEIGRENDDPEGKVVWIEPLDGATLFPTLNKDNPVGQSITGMEAFRPIYFPKHAINRIYMSPRTEIERVGWGMAPPEKIYLALEMLWRGDQYYANLLLDTPEAGLLDLGDMAKDSAEQWLLSYRELLSGIDPFKVSVLYEHEKEVKFIPFIKPPTDLIFDRLSLKYASFVAAGYGLTLGDIGISASSGNGGETLAGSIREERKAKRSGRAVVFRKIKNFYQRLLPKGILQFNWLDQDEEVSQGVARARMGNAQAFSIMIDKGIVSPQECRSQAIADKLFTISIPDELPPEAKPKEEPQAGGGNKNPDIVDQMERPVTPSMGGHGEVKARSDIETIQKTLRPQFRRILGDMSEVRVRRMIRRALNALLPSIRKSVAASSDDELLIESDWFDAVLSGTELDIENYVESVLSTVSEFTDRASESTEWWKVQLDEEDRSYLQSVYAAWFTKSANEIMRRLTAYLYESDFIDHEKHPDPIKASEAVIAMTLLSHIDNMIVEINKGTQTFMNRALLSVVRRQLVLTGMADLLRQGIDIETIMSNNGFIDAVSRSLKDRLTAEFTNRLQVIDEYESAWATNKAIVEQLSAVGLHQKRWNHYGDDKPCEQYCQVAIDAGEVEMSYKYETAFGPSEFGTGHPHCHCRIDFVPSEVQRLISAGEFPIHSWRGA